MVGVVLQDPAMIQIAHRGSLLAHGCVHRPTPPSVLAQQGAPCRICTYTCNAHGYVDQRTSGLGDECA